MIDEMPANFEAEQAVLGSILVNNAAYHEVSGLLRAEHFADPLHGKIYEALGKLIDRGQVVNAIVLKTYVEIMPELKEAGGPSYLARMAGASVHALDAASVARAVVDAAHRRSIIRAAIEALVAARNPDAGDTASRQVERLERGLYDISNDHAEGGFKTFSESLTGAFVMAEAAHKRDGRLGGIATGFPALDRLLGGLHKSDLIILAARPSMGKTALATNIAFSAAVAGTRVGFFSLEMSDEQIALRILAEQAGVPSERVRRGELTSGEFDRAVTVTKTLEGISLQIDPTAALSIGAIRTRARRQQRKHGLDLIVVDYLQLVEATNRKDGRVQEVSEISRGLKALAKELNVPVLALSQLSRAVESRADKRPLLSDLRDLGTIEQDADVVMFIYREEYYRERGSEADRQRVADVAGQAELLIAKHRNGPTGVVHLRFDGAITKFSDQDADELGTAA